MVQAPSKPLTLAEFLTLPETKPASEYIYPGEQTKEILREAVQASPAFPSQDRII